MHFHIGLARSRTEAPERQRDHSLHGDREDAIQWCDQRFRREGASDIVLYEAAPRLWFVWIMERAPRS